MVNLKKYISISYFKIYSLLLNLSHHSQIQSTTTHPTTKHAGNTNGHRQIDIVPRIRQDDE